MSHTKVPPAALRSQGNVAQLLGEPLGIVKVAVLIWWGG